MSTLKQNLVNTTRSVRNNQNSIQKLDKTVHELSKGLTGEIQVKGSQVQTLSGELENITNKIMNKMFEKDDVMARKMNDYDSKLLAMQEAHDTLESNLLLIDQASTDFASKSEQQVRAFT